MGRKKPDIFLDNVFAGQYREQFKSTVLGVITDTFIYEFNPTSISLDSETQRLFTLTLSNKRFIKDNLQVDSIKDYIDIYLFGIKQPQNRYTVSVADNDILVTFTVDITRVPTEVLNTDFVVKGKIVDIE
jgi:hypothetical protein